MPSTDTRGTDAQEGAPVLSTWARELNEHVYQQRFEVRYEYPVYFTEHSLHRDNPVLAGALAQHEPRRRHRVWVALDQGVAQAFPTLSADLSAYARAHEETMSLCGAPFIVAGGEAAKNDPELVGCIQRELQHHGVDRQSFVLAIGGGAVLDAVGFAASTTHRGVRMVRMPTTVLAQNDAGVGVKDSINRFGSKNFLGTFSPPFAVINDAGFLRTLAPRDLRAGMAEAVKVALIRDSSFFGWLRDHAEALARFDKVALTTLVRRAATLHLRHIAEAGDPFERGSARPLDFGHWAAHKLESLSQHELRHGEAVAIGMALDTRYSEQKGYLTQAERAAVFSLLETLGFTLWHPLLEQRDEAGELLLLQGLREFREHMGGELNIPLLREIGQVLQTHAMDPDQVAAAVHFLRTRERTPCA